MDLTRIIAGDTLTITTSVPGYPASASWVLKIRLLLRGAAGDAIAITGTASGDQHVISVPAATTAAWVPGDYTWTAYVEDGSGESHTWRTGEARILPDPRTSTAPLDLRTDAEIALAAAKAAFASWSATTKSYTIGQRSMTFNTKAEIVETIKFWEMEVQRERRAAKLRAGLADPRRAQVRLGRV